MIELRFPKQTGPTRLLRELRRSDVKVSSVQSSPTETTVIVADGTSEEVVATVVDAHEYKEPRVGSRGRARLRAH